MRLVVSLLFKFGLIGIVAGLLSCGPTQNNQDSSYFGEHVGEAQFNLNSKLLIESTTEPSNAKVEYKIRQTMKFALGKMHKYGSISSGFKITFSKIKSEKLNQYIYSYSIIGKGAFAKNLKSIYLFTPYNLGQIYKSAQNKCFISNEDIGEQNFWYHWDPEIKGCPLEEGKDFFKSTVYLKFIESTQLTFPSYENLFKQNEVKITLFVGASDNKNKNWIPYNNGDSGAEDFIEYKKVLIQMGFESVDKQRQFELLKNDKLNLKNLVPYQEVLEKIVKGKKIRVRLLFAETQFYDKKSENFHLLLAAALANEDLIIYTGHSGIGRNLNLTEIEALRKIKIKMNPGYQIIYLGSCIPYSYYMDSFFQRKMSPIDKNGTKNLDILGFAKEAHFGNSDGIRLLKAVDEFASKGIRTSYQDIVTTSPKDFFGVVGDEDNE